LPGWEERDFTADDNIPEVDVGASFLMTTVGFVVVIKITKDDRVREGTSDGCNGRHGGLLLEGGSCFVKKRLCCDHHTTNLPLYFSRRSQMTA